jgi:hypothetical protein
MSEEPHFNKEDGQVLAHYGATMLTVQNLEWAIKRLAIHYTDTPENASLEEAWKAMEKKLERPVGPLVQTLEKQEVLPENLLQELREAAKHRNYLAHEYLIVYRTERSYGRVEPSEAIAFLHTRMQYFEGLHDKLSKLIGELLPSETYEEVRMIVEEIMSEDEFWES